MTDTVKKNTAAGHIQLGAREIIEALPEHMHRRENFTLIYKEETGSTNADAMQLLLEKCTEFLLNYCRAIKRTGVAGVIIAEPAAGLLSDEDCRTFSSIHIRRIVEAVQDESFAVILHNCGNTGHCTQAMLAVGASGYHFGNKADMVEALQSCPADVLVMGNIDPVGVFKQGTPEQVYAETSSLLERTAVFPNFVLSTGCDVPPRIPVENIEAFYQALAQFNR